MIKEQILILKVKYDDIVDQTPHMWNWTELLNSNCEIEVLNHGSSTSPLSSKEECFKLFAC